MCCGVSSNWAGTRDMAVGCAVRIDECDIRVQENYVALNCAVLSAMGHPLLWDFQRGWFS